MWHLGAHLLLAHRWQQHGKLMLQFVAFQLLFAVMQNLYVDYSRSAIGHTYAIYSGAYADSMKGMSTSASDHIVACSEFI